MVDVTAVKCSVDRDTLYKRHGYSSPVVLRVGSPLGTVRNAYSQVVFGSHPSSYMRSLRVK